MGEERRRRLVEILKETGQPVTGSELARLLKVSRQVVVQDVAMLRAAGGGILATPQGYILPGGASHVAHTAVLACQHDPQSTEAELNILVDHGVKVVDVVVEHPVYGELRGLLMVQSRHDVQEFLVCMAKTEASMLSSLTKGVHLHTVQYSQPAHLEKAIVVLRETGFLLEDEG